MKSKFVEISEGAAAYLDKRDKKYSGVYTDGVQSC